MSFLKFKFTNKVHSTGGIGSTIIGLMSFVFFCAGIVISYMNKGNGGMIIAFLAIVSYMTSIAGFYIGLKSFKEEDKFYMFSYIGSFANAIIWLFITVIILIGIIG